MCIRDRITPVSVRLAHGADFSVAVATMFWILLFSLSGMLSVFSGAGITDGSSESSL